MALYTVYWNRERVRLLESFGWLNKPIPWLAGGPHGSQPRFSSAGVVSGDEVVVVSARDYALELIAHVNVERIVSADTFVAETREPLLMKLQKENPDEKHGTCLLDLLVQESTPLRPFLWTCSSEVLHPSKSRVFERPRTFPGHRLADWRYTSKRTSSRPLKFVVDGALKRPLSLQGIYRTAPETADLVRKCIA